MLEGHLAYRAYRARIASAICAVVVREFGRVFCISVFFVKGIMKNTLVYH